MRRKIYVIELLIIVFSFCNLPSFGQFKDAVVSDNSVGLVPVFANNTGNYIFETGGITYIANVWDDQNINNSALSWKVGTATGSITIDQSSIVTDPDVCLVENNAGAVFAIVAYFDQISNQFMMRIFSWNGVTQQFSANPPTVLAPGLFNTAINIDASDEGEFAIVWDQPGQLIQITIGVSTIGLPQLVFPGSAFIIEQGTMPDICFYRNSITNFKQIDVAYINAGNFVGVDFYRFNDLMGGSILPQFAFRSPSADLVYRYPRIDCPAPGFGIQTEFTVVVEDNDNASSYYIKSFNSNQCCSGFTTTIYNDGSSLNSPYNLTDVPNVRPVVAYQNNSSAINVGWNFDNSSGLLAAPGASVARYPIVLSCDRKGKIFPSSSYLVVPLAVTNGTQIGKLSMSGKYSSSGLYTYLNSFNNDIYYKSVSHSVNAVSLRATAYNTFNDWLNSVNLNDTNEKIALTITDMLGREVFYYYDVSSGLHEKLSLFMNSAPTGIYSAQSLNSNQDRNFTGKLYIGN